MYKVLLILFLGITPYSLFSQRKSYNKPLPILSEPFSVLDEAYGYFYSENNKQWKEERNCLSYYDFFRKLEIRQINYDGKEYLLFLKYKEIGYFMNERKIKDYRSFTDVEYIAIDKDEFINKLKKIRKGPNIFSFKIICEGSVMDGVEKLIVKDFASNVYKDKRDINILNIQFTSNKEENYCKFLIFKEIVSELRHSTISRYYFNCLIHESLNKLIYDNLKKASIFDYCFYETDYYTFNRYIRSPLRKQPIYIENSNF